MSFSDTLKYLVQSCQTPEFAAEALADFMTARYTDQMNQINDIMSIITIEDDTQYVNEKATYLSSHDYVPFTLSDGNIVDVSIGDIMTAAHEIDNDGTITIQGNEYAVEDILQNLADSANACLVNAEMIKVMMNEELPSVSDRLSTFTQSLNLKLGGMSESVSMYANAMFNSMQTFVGSAYDAANAIFNWLGLANVETTTLAPDFDGAITSGVSAYGAAGNHLKEFGESIWNGIKKVGSAINNFFGGIFTKAAKVVVETAQTLTGARDAFAVNDSGKSLYFTDYGRNFKMLKTTVDDIVGTAWRDHIERNRYYQFMLPAGYCSVFLLDSDPNYIYCSLFTRPINEATFSSFFSMNLSGTSLSQFCAPDFESEDVTTKRYINSQNAIAWINPGAIQDAIGVTRTAEYQLGYYALPWNNYQNVKYWCDKFHDVANSSIKNVADWLADDQSMFTALRNANIINMIYFALMFRINYDQSALTDTVVWHDLSTQFVSRLNDFLIYGYMYDNTGNTWSNDGTDGHLRKKAWPYNWIGQPIRNSHLSLLLTGSGTARVVEPVAVHLGSIYMPDPIICPSIYIIFGQDKYAAYVNRTYYPSSKYSVLSDSELAKRLGYVVAGASAVGAIVIGVVIAVKLRRAARTIKASIGAMERQATAQLAVLGNGWSSANWAAASAAYAKINKLNKWSTLCNSLANAIYGSLTAIPSYIAGKLSATVNNAVSSISAIVTSGRSFDSTSEETNPISNAKIYKALTGE